MNQIERLNMEMAETIGGWTYHEATSETGDHEMWHKPGNPVVTEAHNLPDYSLTMEGLMAQWSSLSVVEMRDYHDFLQKLLAYPCLANHQQHAEAMMSVVRRRARKEASAP